MSFCNAAFAGNLKYSVRGGLGDRWRPGELLDHGMLAGKSQLDLIVIVLKLRRDLHALGWKVREPTDDSTADSTPAIPRGGIAVTQI